MFFLHCMQNILRYEKIFCELKSQLLHSTITQMVWYFWVFIVNPFSLLWSIFSQQYCVSFGLLVSCWVMIPWFHWSKSNFCSFLSQNDFKSPPSQFYVIYYVFWHNSFKPELELELEPELKLRHNSISSLRLSSRSGLVFRSR